MSAIDLAAEKAAMKETDAQWLAVSKDAAAFVAATDPDFTFFPPGAPYMDDRKEIEDHWRAIIETPGLSLTWAPEGAEVSASGDMGHTWGFFRMTAPDGNGGETLTTGKYVTVMRKQPDGRWLPLNDIFNADS